MDSFNFPFLRASRSLPVKGKFGARAPEVAKVIQAWAIQSGGTRKAQVKAASF